MKIFNAQVYTMTDSPMSGWIEIQNGKIVSVNSGKPDKTSNEDIDANGGILLPGFIDCHTHLGIIENGIGFEGDDCNEETDPATPHLRAVDAINPIDYCFKEALQRGITAVVTGPGSANPVSGDMIAIKTSGRRIDDMLIKTVGIKFSLGENPKTVYNEKDQGPITRMATAAIIRETLGKAKKIFKRY